MIRSFADRSTARLFQGVRVRGVHPELARRAREKLLTLNRAASLADLAARKGNRLEQLGGDRVGQWSIRVTGRWRLCFRWMDDASFGDYHD